MERPKIWRQIVPKDKMYLLFGIFYLAHVDPIPAHLGAATSVNTVSESFKQNMLNESKLELQNMLD